MRRWFLRTLSARAHVRLQGRPRLSLRPYCAVPSRGRFVMKTRPRLGVFKFASCDGCQLSLLDAEDELLAVAGELEITYFPEASSRMEAGPYDVALVEGSITTPQDAERIREVRRQSKFLMTIGACATAGGIQALRNWADS